LGQVEETGEVAGFLTAQNLICNSVQKGKHTVGTITRRGRPGNTLLVGLPFWMRALLPTDEPVLDSTAVIDIGDYPAALEALGYVSGNTSARKRIADKLSRVCS